MRSVAKLATIALDDVTPSTSYEAPRTATGVRWSKRLSPDDYSIWLVVSELDDGAELAWEGEHGDDGVYVVAGELDVDGHRCPADGAVVVESGVSCTARALGPARIVHCGARDSAPPTDGLYGPPAPDGHGVHIVGERGWYVSGSRERVVARWFADSTCPTCRISLFHVWRGEGGVRDRPHTHSQDELILALYGSVLLGRREHAPGTCLAVPADVRYSITSGPDGLAFLNYRRDVSVQGYGRDESTEFEGGIVRGGVAVNAFR